MRRARGRVLTSIMTSTKKCGLDAIAVTTVDGQQYRVGDADTPFCIQSCSKPLSYLLALDEFGADYVHKHVGTEPSGHAFNHVALKECEGGKGEVGSPSAIPHNPCINAGAMMTVSMVYPHEKSRQQRLPTLGRRPCPHLRQRLRHLGHLARTA